MTTDQARELLNSVIAIAPAYSSRRTKYMRVTGWLTSDMKFDPADGSGIVERVMGHAVTKRLHPTGDYFVARDDGTEGYPTSFKPGSVEYKVVQS